MALEPFPTADEVHPDGRSLLYYVSREGDSALLSHRAARQEWWESEAHQLVARGLADYSRVLQTDEAERAIMQVQGFDVGLLNYIFDMASRDSSVASLASVGHIIERARRDMPDPYIEDADTVVLEVADLNRSAVEASELAAHIAQLVSLPLQSGAILLADSR